MPTSTKYPHLTDDELESRQMLGFVIAVVAVLVWAITLLIAYIPSSRSSGDLGRALTWAAITWPIIALLVAWPWRIEREMKRRAIDRERQTTVNEAEREHGQ